VTKSIPEPLQRYNLELIRVICQVGIIRQLSIDFCGSTVWQPVLAFIARRISGNFCVHCHRQEDGSPSEFCAVVDPASRQTDVSSLVW